ncbi:beta-galactosidase/beta-glucuronidase [Streptomyces sp. B1I3]|nr:beta-galactosidase/beta-glucuronidase [Streptomyces sp. B1I3]
MAECDLETHGFERADRGCPGPEPVRGNPERRQRNPSDDPRWHDACSDRIEWTVERDKNHPSVILWSLGVRPG